MIDHKSIDRDFFRPELETELLFDCGKKIWLIGVAAVFRSEAQIDVEHSGDAGMVHNGRVRRRRQQAGDAEEIYTAALNVAGCNEILRGFTGLLPKLRGVNVGRFQLRAAFGDDQAVAGNFFCAGMDGDVESLSKHLAQHRWNGVICPRLALGRSCPDVI